jgi:hypothetical protein
MDLRFLSDHEIILIYLITMGLFAYKEGNFQPF